MNENTIHTSDTITKITLGEKEIILLGTAHISKESVDEVERVVEEEQPGRILVEIDAARFQSMSQKNQWESLNIFQVIKQRRTFLLLANLVLSSFQRRLGFDLGMKPGEEMKKAIEVAKAKNIPFTFCDRDIQVTFRRAWGLSSFWGKNKMLAALISSAFTKEKLSEEEIENLKSKSALHGMLEELAEYLPSVKEVLIDERDQYMACKIFSSAEKKVVAVVGAGHVPGIVRWLNGLHEQKKENSVAEIEVVPPRGIISKALPFVIPAAVIGLIVLGFFRSGWEGGLEMLKLWVLVNGTLSAVGALIALAHPLTIIASFLAAPITSLNPTVGVGFVTGILESLLRKPRVEDFNRLQEDILSLKGFYRNRVTHILLVFFFSSVGSSVGTFIGIPWLGGVLGFS